MGKRQNFPKPDSFEPIPSWPDDHGWSGQLGRCQAWDPVHGRQCLRRAVKGKRVCKKDGGASLEGIGSPRFKHGRRSKVMPKVLAPMYEAAMADTELLDLRTDIATQDARIIELLGSLEEGNPGELWIEALKESTGLWEAVARKDDKDVATHRQRLGEILVTGSGQVSTWLMIQKHTDEKRKLVEAEGRRREKMQRSIQIEDAQYAYRGFVLAVKKHVKDPEILRAIADEWARTARLVDIPGATTSDV